MTEKTSAPSDSVAQYKAILRSVIEQRPSGMGQRLSEALGKNRSFISQIANPAYKIPVPHKHLDTIFKVCGFSKMQKEAFLAEYYRAHPKYDKNNALNKRLDKKITIPSTGNSDVDAKIEKLVIQMVDEMVDIYRDLK